MKDADPNFDIESFNAMRPGSEGGFKKPNKYSTHKEYISQNSVKLKQPPSPDYKIVKNLDVIGNQSKKEIKIEPLKTEEPKEKPIRKINWK